MADYIKPKTITDSSGKYLINNNDQTNGYVVSDGTNNRVLIGYDKDGFGTGKDFGIKVSKEGYEVSTTGDANLIMNSAYNMFKIVATGTATLTLPNPTVAWTSYTTTVTHNLGFEPVHTVFVKAQPSLGSELFSSPRTVQDGSGAVAQQIGQVCTSTTITFNFASNGAAAYNGSVWTFKYYLFQETAQ